MERITTERVLAFELGKTAARDPSGRAAQRSGVDGEVKESAAKKECSLESGMKTAMAGQEV